MVETPWQCGPLRADSLETCRPRIGYGTSTGSSSLQGRPGGHEKSSIIRHLGDHTLADLRTRDNRSELRREGDQTSVL